MKTTMKKATAMIKKPMVTIQKPTTMIIKKPRGKLISEIFAYGRDCLPMFLISCD